MLPDSDIEELVAQLELIAGGPNGPGVPYVQSVLGTLAMRYSDCGAHGVSIDLARLVARLGLSRFRAALLAAGRSPGGGPS